MVHPRTLVPRRGHALVGAAWVAVMPLLALPGIDLDALRAGLSDKQLSAGTLASLLIVGLLVIVPGLAYQIILSSHRLQITAESVRVGRQTLSWQSVRAVTWEGRRGGNTLILHGGDGQTVRLEPSVYPGREEAVLAQLGHHLPPNVLGAAEAELLAAER